MGLGMWEIGAILLVAILFFGPSRLPGLGKSVGEAIRGFKKGIEGHHEEQERTARTEMLNNGPERESGPNA